MKELIVAAPVISKFFEVITTHKQEIARIEMEREKVRYQAEMMLNQLQHKFELELHSLDLQQKAFDYTLQYYRKKLKELRILNEKCFNKREKLADLIIQMQDNKNLSILLDLFDRYSVEIEKLRLENNDLVNSLKDYAIQHGISLSNSRSFDKMPIVNQ